MKLRESEKNGEGVVASTTIGNTLGGAMNLYTMDGQDKY
jgi:hypothetical protein